MYFGDFDSNRRLAILEDKDTYIVLLCTCFSWCQLDDFVFQGSFVNLNCQVLEMYNMRPMFFFLAIGSSNLQNKGLFGKGWGLVRESQKEYRHKQSRIVSYSPLALLHMEFPIMAFEGKQINFLNFP